MDQIPEVEKIQPMAVMTRYPVSVRGKAGRLVRFNRPTQIMERHLDLASVYTQFHKTFIEAS